MSFLVLRKCCCCVDLRIGSFIIGYLTLIYKVSLLIFLWTIIQMRIPITNEQYDEVFHCLIVIITMMVLVFEILLCIVLLVGLHQRLDQNVEMCYVGSSAFLVVGVVSYAAVMLRYAEKFVTTSWVLVGLEIFMKLLLIYFLTVIRSYYYKMKREVKDDLEEVNFRDTAKTYFARTKPVLFGSKAKALYI